MTHEMVLNYSKMTKNKGNLRRKNFPKTPALWTENGYTKY